jgi:hypothetical protein
VFSPDEGDFSAEAARALLNLRFSDQMKNRIRQLLAANNREEISDLEKGDLDKFFRVGQLLDLLQAKARISLNNRNT